MDKEKIEQAVRLFLEGIGEDVDREGLLDTPARISEMCKEIFGGVGNNAKDVLERTFSAENNEMVVVRDISFLFRLRASFTAVLRNGEHRIYSRWKGSRTEQASACGGGICTPATDTGADDGTDC